MVKNTQTGTVGQENYSEAVLSLLAAIVTRNGHSLSWYTSRKGRIWFTLVGFSPIRYTTSTESIGGANEEEVRTALMVCMANHIPKLQGRTPPLNTWITRKAIEEQATEAVVYCNALYARWKNGEPFWDIDYPDRPLPGADELGADPTS